MAAPPDRDRGRPYAALAPVLIGLLALASGCSREPPFTREGDSWRYRGHLLAVDAASFRPLGAHHGIDAAQAIHADTSRESSDYFTTARLRLTRIAGADLPSFRVLDDHHARDRHGVYHQGLPWAVADAASLELLDGGFARDRVRGYWHHAPVGGSDGASFVVAGDHHAKDARQVWWCAFDHSRQGPAVPRCTAIAGVDPARFEPLGRGYARSGDRIVHQSRAVPGVDAASFTVDDITDDGDGDAHDARRRYRDGQPIEAATAVR